MAKIRLDKYIAEQETITRSKVKDIIKRRNVCVNNITIRDGSVKIEPCDDKVTIDGKVIVYKKFIYIMLNKPAGVVTATKDNTEKTVIDIIGDEIIRKKSLSPVGRLDKDTTGMLLLTDDGALNHRLLSPKSHVSKKYLAVVDKPLADFDAAVSLCRQGLNIGDEKDTLPALLQQAEIRNGYYLTITEGRYHQVKRMFRVLGAEVIKLKRLSMGRLVMDKNLQEGMYRYLTEEEIDLLK